MQNTELNSLGKPSGNEYSDPNFTVVHLSPVTLASDEANRGADDRAGGCRISRMVVRMMAFIWIRQGGSGGMGSLEFP